jgi:hypothetical protein
MYTYTILANGTVLRSDGASIPAEGNTPTQEEATPPLAAAQAAQITAISAACQAAIYAGFSSSALGAAHTYPAEAKDQTNLASSVLSALLTIQGAVQWAASTVQPVGALVAANGQVYVNGTLGTTGPNAPTWPSTVGFNELDGGAQWQLWTTPFWCEDSSGNWAWVNHTTSQIMQVGRDGKAAILTLMAKNQTLATAVMAATTVAAVEAINWS